MKFVSKDLALKLKEKGFDKPCLGFYNPIQDELQLYCANNKDVTYKNILTSVYKNKVLVDAPTIEQVLKWLREKDVYVWIEPYNTFATKNHLAFQWNITLSELFEGKDQFDDKDTLYTHVHLDIEHWEINYDDAVIAGIEYVVNKLI